MSLHDKHYGLISFEKPDFMKYWFDLKRQKTIHCVDTLYYTVDFLNDWLYDAGVQSLLDYFDSCKKRYYELNETVVMEKLDTMYVFDGGMSFAKIYYYCVQSTDRYWVFFAKGKPGKNVPAVLVQLRSQFLWLNGEKKAVELSLMELQENIFAKFGLEVKVVKENRIDFAYHTNYIQKPEKFFQLNKLNASQVSRFKQWRMIGSFEGDNDIGVDYIGLGVRECNNVFVRMYNKANEVVTKGYKQFFLQCWLLNGLISRFDFYCLEKCFLRKSYDYLARSRLEWYCEYGPPGDMKELARDFLSNDKIERDDVEMLANKLVPRVTIVFNIEYQCKRDFLSTLKFENCKVDYDKRFKSILQLLRNKKLVHDYLTEYVLRFVDPDRQGYDRKRDKPVAPFWKRIQKMKLDVPVPEQDVEMVREYQRNIDKELIKNKVRDSVATFSLYNNNINDANFDADIIDYLSYLNENDLKDYKFKKTKKAKQVASKLVGLPGNDHVDKSIIVKDYVIIDCVSGEIIEVPTSDIISITD